MQVGLADYQSQIAEVRLGKRVGTSIYFHQECISSLPSGITSLLEAATASAAREAFNFNVFKLDTRFPSVSLLHYPAFFET